MYVMTMGHDGLKIKLYYYLAGFPPPPLDVSGVPLCRLGTEGGSAIYEASYTTLWSREKQTDSKIAGSNLTLGKYFFGLIFVLRRVFGCYLGLFRLIIAEYVDSK